MAPDTPKPIRYAVVGLGHIAQNAVLPAFKHARRNSRLAALVSDDPEKLETLGDTYKVKARYSYDEYEDCLKTVDAVYIALPNSMHADYTVRAANAGVHVLCEKPMAVTVEECERMIEACREANVKLMIAYRLHFEEINLRAVELVRSGRLGEPKYFNSSFSMQVKPGNVRTRRETGGGTLYDIGIYCINAARYLFRAEPKEVMAMSVNSVPDKLPEIDESTAAILRFDGERVASFVSSFNAADAAAYHIVGTEGRLDVNPAYEYSEGLAYTLTVDGKTEKKKIGKRDQFAPELLYFSDCVLTDQAPEPSGDEGLQDVRIIQALYESADTGKAVQLPPYEPAQRPDARQQIVSPPVKEPEIVNAEAAHEE
jgi:glucose-fructose oxidoreductase